MNSEEMRLLRENNIMLRQILSILQNNQPGTDYGKDFVVNVLADQISRAMSFGNY